jgi:hypothetical protein
MAGIPCITIEMATAGSTLYYGSHAFTSGSGDTPASTFFAPRLLNSVGFNRSVGCHFWQQAPRGEQGFDIIELCNADGHFDSYVGQSLRDKTLVIKRGNNGDAYSTFTTVATLLVDRVDFTNENVLRVYTKSVAAKLDRPLQSSLYPTTLSNGALRGRPRPITIGRCYQVPLQQPELTGNGHYDVHDHNWWAGIEQYMDQGATILEVSPFYVGTTGYRRSSKTGVYGAERTSAVAGKQVATVLGAVKRDATIISEDFAALGSFTETGGGAGGRDASISANQLRMLNTAGGANLTLQHNTAITPVSTFKTFFLYEVDVTSFTSGACGIDISGVSSVRVLSGTGHYSGVMRYTASFNISFVASNGSNCDMLLDNLRVYRVTPIERLSDVVKYVATSDSDYAGKGPLTVSDLDTTTISAVDTAAPYSLGFHASDPIMISDVLDQVMQSYGGWWYVNRTGKLTVGRLTAPSGSATYTFDQSNIAPGMRVSFDEARGLSNLILAKRNWSPYEESEIVGSLNYVQLSSSDKDADVTLSNSNYSFSTTNTGSARSTPSIFGDRIYFEVTVGSAADANWTCGYGNSLAAIASFPGADSNAIAYSAFGQIIQNFTVIAAPNSYTAGDVIGFAIDLRPSARGETAVPAVVYARKNGTWQLAANPDTEAQTALSQPNAGPLLAHVMIGNNAATTKSGEVNFGNKAFTYDPPDDYIAPAWHRTLICQQFRYSYESTVALHASYAHADGSGKEDAGTPTLLSKAADARTECDRWATLYSVERFFYEFDAFMDSVAADQIEPGDVISVTYPRFGLSSKLLRVVGIKGSLLDRKVTITAWG